MHNPRLPPPAPASPPKGDALQPGDKSHRPHPVERRGRTSRRIDSSRGRSSSRHPGSGNLIAGGGQGVRPSITCGDRAADGYAALLQDGKPITVRSAKKRSAASRGERRGVQSQRRRRQTNGEIRQHRRDLPSSAPPNKAEADIVLVLGCASKGGNPRGAAITQK